MSSIIALFLSLQSTIGGNGGNLAVIILDAPEQYDTASAVEALESAVAVQGRFTPVWLPDSVRHLEISGSYSADMTGICSEYSLDVLMALSISEPDTVERAYFQGDSLVTSRRTDVTATGLFYTSAGTLAGTVTETVSSDSRPPMQPDLDRMAREASLAVLEKAMLELFPAETRFTASGGADIDLPAGSDDGLSKGMFVSLVAMAPSIPDDISQYRFLRSHGIAQIVQCDNGASRARLLSGSLVEGGTVTALERGAPALVSACWEMAPVELAQGAETEDLFDADRVMNRIRMTVSTLRWGFNFGGTLFAGAMENLSSFGVDFHAGLRMPLSAPRLAAVLNAGTAVEFEIQDVATDTLVSDATAASFGGYAECGLEMLASDRLGLTFSAVGFAGSEADSWTVQEMGGQNREAYPSELYFASVKRSPLTLRAGLFYLIF